jgi:pilus assembly protein CpaE
MEKITILVADDVPQTRKDITRLLYFEEDMDVIGEAGDGVEALQKIGDLKPDVILMDINMPQMDGIAATERICELYPTVAVVIISIQGEPEYMKKAMFAGARDYLVKPLSSEEMANSIRNVYRQQKQRTRVSQVYTPPQPPQHETMQYVAEEKPSMMAQPAASSPPQDLMLPQKAITVENKTEAPAAPSAVPAVIPQESHNAGQHDEKPLGMVTTVFCGKGGVGKTTLATNLAVVLSQSGKKKVALIDLDLQFGDIAVMLNLTDGKTICELVREHETFSSEILQNYMLRHFTGIDILPAPVLPQHAEYVNPEHIEAIIKCLKQNYDYIIVDTSPMFHDINLQALDMSEQILLVVTRDIATIKNAKTSLNILDSLNYRERVRLVLNRSDQDLGVDIPDLEKGLEIVVSHQIPGDERTVVSAINKGVPVILSNSSSDIAKSFRRMSERMVSGKRLPVPEKQNKPLINRIFSL